ncbi:MAG: sugar phosphate nucleotidyltransferase [Candidatus Omnitrophica bacterium]|nr:sugar phosphate nucleotidyltransferase [Candidatus Omnitrophota bacterium]
MSRRASRNLAAVVLAAGDGTRMLSRIPKVIHALYGKPLIHHVLDAIRKAGVQQIVVVVGYRSDLVRKQLSAGVQTVVQKQLKGTAHAVMQAMPRLKNFQGDIIVLYGDTPLLTAQTVQGLIQTHRRQKAVCTLLTAQLKDPAGYGRIVRDQTGRIVRIVEDADASQAEKTIEEINVGAYCFNAKALRRTLKQVKPAPNGEYYLTDTVSHLVKSGAELASASTRSVGEFMGINTRADLARVQTIMRSRILEKFMLRGVTIVDPYTTYIDGSATIGQDTVVYPHTVIEKGVRIGRGCHLGPFCRVGSNSTLADGVFVGNFVELSNCAVGRNSKIFQHSFISNTSIGRDVQIGAGTVTVSPNGMWEGLRNRRRIRIGDRAHIQGGSLFLGPAFIKPGEVVKAGSAVRSGS